MRSVFLLCLFIFSLISCAQKQPNVLFISIDDLNDWTGKLEGNNQVISPNLDGLADSGVLFTNAHASMAVCIASRNSLLSGMHPTTTGWYALNGDQKAMNENYKSVMHGKQMLPELFRNNGYQTFAAGKVFHTGTNDFDDLEGKLWDEALPKYKPTLRAIDYERGEGYGGYKFYPFPKEGSQLNRHYGEKLGGGHSLSGGQLDSEDMPNGKMFDELIADFAVDKLSQKHDKPFFLSVGFVRPHVPYTAPRKFFDMYNADSIQLPKMPIDEMKDIPNIGKAIAFNYGIPTMGDYEAVKGMGDDYWRHLIHSYLACVSFVDDQLGRVLEALENSEYADNTIIVLWSDHGQSMGEKMNFRKMSLWEESTKVPLVIATPNGKSRGKKVTAPVSLLDLYPTLVDLCELPKQKHLDGNSLEPLLNNPTSDWKYPVISNWRYRNYSVRSENYRYIQYRDGTEEFYDHTVDPGEHDNNVSNKKYAKIIENHKEWIPKKAALPIGTTSWNGDEIEKRLEQWKAQDSIPVWLR